MVKLWRKGERKYEKIISLFLCCLMVLLLTGCGGSSEEDTSTYTYSSELDIKNLDSSDADDGCSFRAIHAIIDGLMKTDKKGNITYGIAKSEEVSDDGLINWEKMLSGIMGILWQLMTLFMRGIEFLRIREIIIICLLMV